MEVDTVNFRLLKDGHIISIEPQVFDLLVYLIINRERLVTRQEILDEIWQDRVVSDTALSNLIKLARKVIGDDGYQQRVIKTVHGRGYQFIKEVTDSLPNSDQNSPSNTSHESELNTSNNTLSRPLRATLLLVVLAFVVWIIFEQQRPRIKPVVAISPVALADPSTELQLAGLSITDLLFQRLTELRGIELRSPERFHNMATASEVIDKARKLGAHYIIQIRLKAPLSGDKAQLLVSLNDLRQQLDQPIILGRFDLNKDITQNGLSDFLVVREEIVSQVQRILLSAVSLPESKTNPAHYQAYRLYLKAKDLLRRPGCDGTGPNHLLQESLNSDPDFAPAWVALGWAEYGLVATCGLGAEHYEAALVAVDRALNLSPYWVPAISLQATILVEMGEVRRAESLLLEATNVNSDSADLHFALSYANYYLGDLDKAEKLLEKTLSLDANFLTANGWTPNVYLYTKQYQRFLDILPATRSTLFNFYRGFALAKLGKHKEAQFALSSSYQENPTDIFGQLSAVLELIESGDLESALSLLTALQQQRSSSLAKDGEVSFRIAQLMAMAGDLKGANSQLHLSWQQGFQCRLCIDNDPTLASLAIKLSAN